MMKQIMLLEVTVAGKHRHTKPFMWPQYAQMCDVNNVDFVNKPNYLKNEAIKKIVTVTYCNLLSGFKRYFILDNKNIRFISILR